MVQLMDCHGALMDYRVTERYHTICGNNLEQTLLRIKITIQIMYIRDNTHDMTLFL